MSEKLDIKQTVLIGTAFLSICAFWQMYNNVIPLILTNTFHLNETPVETWFTTYAAGRWQMSLGSSSLCLTIATLGAIVTYIPAGAAAGKIGRKKTILIGVGGLTAAFLILFACTLFSDRFHPVLYGIFVLVGISWAMINVNSLPMVVEMCRGSDIGKFTGYYYTFSMAAQTVTPIAAGFLMNRIGYTVLFPYSAAFSLLAILTMSRVRHGDGRITEKKSGLEAFEDFEA